MRSENGEPTMTAIATIDERALLLRMERCRRDVRHGAVQLRAGFNGATLGGVTLPPALYPGGQEAIGGADPGTRSGVPRRRVPSTGSLSCLGSRDTGVQNGADSNNRRWRGAPRMHSQRIR